VRLANEIYVEQGRRDGHDLEGWFQAEKAPSASRPRLNLVQDTMCTVTNITYQES
jgi:hypothetical protein